MKALINDNTMKACDLEVSAVDKIPELAVVKEVRISNVLDAEGKRTDKVDCIKYDCVNPDNFSTFTIKVNTTRPAITNEIIDGADEPIYISIPVEEVVIRPYKIEYGKAKVSIIAPYVKLAQE